MMARPASNPSTVPMGPAWARYVLQVTTREPQPTLVPRETAHTCRRDR